MHFEMNYLISGDLFIFILKCVLGISYTCLML